MILTVFSSLAGIGIGYWFVRNYNLEQREYSNAELKAMSDKFTQEQKGPARQRKLILTQEEIQEYDPTFKPPVIPRFGEPDI